MQKLKLICRTEMEHLHAVFTGLSLAMATYNMSNIAVIFMNIVAIKLLPFLLLI